MKSKTNKRIHQISTESGKNVIATDDHPFYTPDGMAKLKNIKQGEMVAILPFTGVDFKEPPDKTILKEKDILKLPLKKNLSQTIDELKKEVYYH